MTRKHARTRKLADMTLIPTTFGEQVTADHLVTNRAETQRVDGSAYAVVIFDRHQIPRLLPHGRQGSHRSSPIFTGLHRTTPDCILIPV